MGVSDGVAPEFYTHKTLPSYQAMLAWEIVVLVGLFDPLTMEMATRSNCNKEFCEMFYFIVCFVTIVTSSNTFL